MAEMDEVFKALADPSRRLLLDSLNARNGQNLQELCAGLSMARQSVSKHLAVLEDANLITTVWRGREKLHYLNAEPINAIADRWITQYDRARVQTLADLKTALETESMSSTGEFVYTTYIRTTPEKLWQAITDPAFSHRYMGHAMVSDWNKGSTYAWEDHGLKIEHPEQVILESDPYRRLAFTFHTFVPELATAVEQLDEQTVATCAAERRSEGLVRHRTRWRDGQADRHPRRLRPGQHGAGPDLRRLAVEALQLEDRPRTVMTATPAAGRPGRLPEPNSTRYGCGRRRTPARGTRSRRPGGACRWSRWTRTTPLVGPDGPVTLLDAFEGRTPTDRLLLHVVHRPSRSRAVRGLHVVHHPGRGAVLPAFPRHHVRGLLPGPVRREPPLQRLHGLGHAVVLGARLPRHAPRRARRSG